MRFLRAALVAMALIPARGGLALATVTSAPASAANSHYASFGAGVLIETGIASPEGPPTHGALSPMSLGKPPSNSSAPGHASAIRTVRGPDGKVHATGVNMGDVSPMPVHQRDEDPDEPPAPRRGHVDLRSQFPPVRDQGAMGSCVGFGFAALADFLAGQRKAAWSPLALWSEGRKREGSFPKNEGVAMQDAADIMNLEGSLPEVVLPYPEGIQPGDPRFGYTLQSSASPGQYETLGRRPAVSVVALPSADQIMVALDAGVPVAIAFYEPRQFDYPSPGGIVDVAGSDVPKSDSHCVVVVGYDDRSRRLIVRNSWGTAWGDHGYCYMSYDFIDQGYIFQAFSLGTLVNKAARP